MKKLILSIGSAYVDINVPGFLFNKSGLVPETETVGGEYILELGGSAINFAKLCSSLNIPTAFVGKIGQDKMGNVLGNMLVQSGIKPLLIKSKDVSTNLSFNIINNKGKSIMLVAGTANQNLAPKEVYKKCLGQLINSEYLYLGGCFKLKKLLPLYKKLVQQAKQNNVKVVLDHGRINQDTTEIEKEMVRNLAMLADIYLPSYDEFIQLWNINNFKSGLISINKQLSGILVIKNSNKGAITVIDNKIIKIPAYKIKPIHTIGAGDSFNAGFIASYSKNNNIKESIIFGCATSALKLSKNELPIFSNVTNFINAQK